MRGALATSLETPAAAAHLDHRLLDPVAAREVLTSRRYQRRVLDDGRAATRLGARGVPFVVIDGKYGVAGAQPVEVFLEALEQAWRERPGLVAPAGEANVCGPDGCDA